MSRNVDEEEAKTPIVTKLVGTAAFVAPEMILATQQRGITAYRNFEEASKGDVYAFGILMAAIVSEKNKELYVYLFHYYYFFNSLTLNLYTTSDTMM